jgi:hypothetical protein
VVSADIPVERPTQIDLKTAKGLGLKLPDSFLLRVDAAIA